MQQNHKNIFTPDENIESSCSIVTKKEIEVLQLLADGKKQKNIALIKNLSERTVRNYVYSINQKLESNSTIESIVKAIQQGIIEI